MIDVITPKTLRGLAEVHGAHCVSLYLPTHASGEETVQDPVRLRNLAARAADELSSVGARGPDVDRLLAPLAELQRNRDFWAHQGRGLAVFVSADGTRSYRLPDAVDELVVVADRFHLKPLLPCVTSGEVFHVLALSQNQVRLLRGSRYSVNELALDETPESLAEALRFDDREPQLQSHASLRTGSGQVSATFHGQGAVKDAHDIDIDRFLAAVDAGVRHIVGNEGTPLVLAGVTDLVARYRRVTRYPNVVDGAIAGNPERTHADELHDLAWPLVRPLFDAARRASYERIMSASGTTTPGVAEVVLAAHDGRVRSLFVQTGFCVWGRFDAESRDVASHDERRPGDRDLLDVATLDTLLAGGDVFAVPSRDVPGGGPLAVEFRF